jgi:hypothetical protein
MIYQNWMKMRNNQMITQIYKVDKLIELDLLQNQAK